MTTHCSRSTGSLDCAASCRNRGYTCGAAGGGAASLGKSGVGGGIVAIVPDHLSLCVWSPALDATGNSLLGRQALELFVAKTGLSVF